MNSLQTFLFIFQIVLCVLIILFVLLQQTDEDSLSGIGAGGANAKMLSKRTVGTPISKFTMVLFILFMFNSLLLATFSARNYTNNNSTIESFIENEESKVKEEKSINQNNNANQNNNSSTKTENKDTVKTTK